MPKLSVEERETVIASLVGNCSCSEKGKVVLNQLDDDDLSNLAINALPTQMEEDDNETDDEEAAEGGEGDEAPPIPKGKKKMVGNSKKTVEDEEAVINSLSAETREDLAFARREKTRQKNVLITRLVANAEKDEVEELTEVLNAKPLAELELMARLAGKGKQQRGEPEPAPVINHLGRVGSSRTLATNSKKAVSRTEVLVAPQIDWAAEFGTKKN